VLAVSVVSLGILYRKWTAGELVEEPGGSAVTFLIGAGGPTLFCVMKLVTTLDSNHLSLRFSPLRHRKIPLNEIVRWEGPYYNPLLEYGGWGLRWRPGKGKAYNVSGRRGVQLHLAGGEELLVGSQRPEELSEALSQAK
jgi:hypothetical protein